MATPTDDAMTQCAACSKGGDSLKTCTACKLVKYCGVDCQRAHRPQHKKACKRRAAELYDEELFKQPPSREECPICFLELPILADKQTYKTCCGKILCNGCDYASAVTQSEAEDEPCAFCREPVADSIEEEIKRIERRAEMKDPEALAELGHNYIPGSMGRWGSQQNINKALELLHRAAELGSIDAHFYLGGIYYGGDGVQVDEKKAKHHWEIAAIAGHVESRNNLGALEENNGNHYRSMKHLMISASAGYNDSMKAVQSGYRDGLVNKDDFEKTLRAHKKSSDELKSEWRDKAKAFADQDRVI